MNTDMNININDKYEESLLCLVAGRSECDLHPDSDLLYPPCAQNVKGEFY